MERQELEALLTLAEELHFGRTATRLGVSPSRVTQIIQKLERRVGAPLVERTSRRVVLTPIGARLCEDLRPAHRMIESAFARAVSAGRGVSGELRIGYSSPQAVHLVLAAKEALRTTHPDCAVSIQEIQPSDPYGPLRGNQVHIQVTELPVDEPDFTVGPELFTADRALLVPSDHALAHRASVSLEDLAYTTLLTIGGVAPQHWLDYHFPRYTPSGRPISHGHAAISWQEIPFLIAEGAGVSMACASAESHVGIPGVTWIPLEEDLPIRFAAIWPRQGTNTLLRTFVTCLYATAGRPLPTLSGIDL
ncbi:LysR family transcriptional regulator [Nocardia sp. NPDC001965]